MNLARFLLFLSNELNEPSAERAPVLLNGVSSGEKSRAGTDDDGGGGGGEGGVGGTDEDGGVDSSLTDGRRSSLLFRTRRESAMKEISTGDTGGCTCAMAQSKLKLYVWNGKWDLPSIEPDCLAAILYLQLAFPGDFDIVECTNPDLSPSGSFLGPEL
jgi:hypothetical protein